MLMLYMSFSRQWCCLVISTSDGRNIAEYLSTCGHVQFVGSKLNDEVDLCCYTLDWRVLITNEIPQINFTFVWPCIVTNLFVIKPTRCTDFTNLFCHETLHVSDSSSVHHQEFIYCTLSNGICHRGTVQTAFEQDQDVTAVPSWSCSKAVYKPVWHTPVPSIQWINSWWWAEELCERYRVSCRTKFGK
jgi:hypothetical protein